jgi:uncharacterized protein YrzB (UPF0473 family)
VEASESAVILVDDAMVDENRNETLAQKETRVEGEGAAEASETVIVLVDDAMVDKNGNETLAQKETKMEGGEVEGEGLVEASEAKKLWKEQVEIMMLSIVESLVYNATWHVRLCKYTWNPETAKEKNIFDSHCHIDRMMDSEPEWEQFRKGGDPFQRFKNQVEIMHYIKFLTWSSMNILIYL